MLMRASPYLGAVLLLAGCATVPPAQPEPPPPRPSMPPTSDATPSAPDWPPIPTQAAAPAMEPPVTNEPLEPVVRALTEIALPAKTARIRFLRADRSGPDVLALSTQSDLLRIKPNGKAQRIKGPNCEETFFHPMTITPDYQAVTFEDGHMVLFGRLLQSGRGSYYVGYRSVQKSGGTWTCEQTYPPVEGSIAPGDVVWSLLNNRLVGTLVNDARLLPMPAVNAPATAFWGRTADRAWLATGDKLVHFDGLTWTAVEHPFDLVRSVTEDPTGTLWVIGERAKRAFAAALPPHGSWAWVAVPPDFDATHVVAPTARDIWFLGDKFYYQYDGRALRSVVAPVLSPMAWVDSSGEIWVGGLDPSLAPVVEDELQRRDARAGKLVRIAAAADGGGNIDATADRRAP
ncbi:MAG: hypothetical protein U0271_13685 [Polyangiaceae bacterium]